MPRNGSGAYSRAVTPPVNGDVADADDFNDEMDDIATALTNSLAKNGETTPTANLPMGGYVLTGLGAGDANGESVRYEQVSPLLRPTETVLSPTIMSGLIYGLTLSNNGSDATNDIDIAAGIAIDGSNAKFMNLASAITKRLDAAWAVGSGNGGLDTGSIANTWYYLWLIMRSDTGVVDALFSTSATAPTMPSNYDYKRRIGAVLRSGGSLVAFVQRGDEFLYTANPIADVSVTNLGTTATLYTLSVPPSMEAIIQGSVNHATAGTSIYISSPSVADQAVSTTLGRATSRVALNNTVQPFGYQRIRLNSSSQLRAVSDAASSSLYIGTFGWIDRRGQDA